MDSPEPVELDEDLLPKPVREFALDLFERFPAFRQHAAMKWVAAQAAWSLGVTVPAPSGDSQAELFVWMDPDDEPSVAFGGWHTHESVWGWQVPDGEERAAFFDLISGILADRFVASEDIGSPVHDWRFTLLDLSIQDELLNELTDKHSPGRVRLRSWSGRLDREVGLTDLEPDATGPG